MRFLLIGSFRKDEYTQSHKRTASPESDDDLSDRVASGGVLARLFGLLHVEDALDHRLDFAPVHQVGHLVKDLT